MGEVISAFQMSGLPENYTLIVAEKPDAARRIASALGQSSTGLKGHPEYFLCPGKTNYVVVPAVGHIFALAPTYSKRDVYPALDLRWVPLSLVDKRRKDVDKRIKAFKSISKKASKLIVACDYDAEGDTIGYNILKYACGVKNVEAFRAKFSTLTNGELSKSLSEPVWQEKWPMAEAGRTRHFLDFAWGVNLSRALTECLLEAGGRYTTLSIGRVQGPTIHYIHEREVEIRTHVPVPYWHADAEVEADRNHFRMDYSIHRIGTKVEAFLVKREVEGKTGTVEEAIKSQFMIPPPPPFNLGDLQHEAFRLFSLAPSQTLLMAERLYLQAVISYPRTSSQQLPNTIGYSSILEGLSKQETFKSIVLSMLKGKLTPSQGQKSDSAHPAIFPTGEFPYNLEPNERRLYELIVRRFLSSFLEAEVKNKYFLRVTCGKHAFHTSSTTTQSPGWSAVYNVNDVRQALTLPPMAEGSKVTFISVEVKEAFDSPPSRYNQSTLLERMESDNIGTKATRAEIISTLIQRGYVSGGGMELSDLGFAIVETMSKYLPSILSPDMTRSIEAQLEGVEAGTSAPKEVAVTGVDQLLSCLRRLEANRSEVGKAMHLAAAETIKAKSALGPCPVCHNGQLIMIRSRRTGKRFVGCSNYKRGCKAVAPLPQKGTVRAARYPCKTCGWPVVLVFALYGERPWRLCINPTCPSKVTTTKGGAHGGPVD